MFTLEVINPLGEVEQTHKEIGEKRFSFADEMIELAEMNLNMVADDKGKTLSFEQAIEEGWKFRITQWIDGIKLVSDLIKYPDERGDSSLDRDRKNDGHRITLTWKN